LPRHLHARLAASDLEPPAADLLGDVEIRPRRVNRRELAAAVLVERFKPRGQRDYSERGGQRDPHHAGRGGTFNVQTATCGSVCINCCGYNNFVVLPSNYYCPVGQSMQCDLQGTNCNDGTSTFSANWTSSNTSVMTINSSGVMTSVAPGTATIAGQVNSYIEVTQGQVCSGFNPVCPTGEPGGSTTATVDSLVFTINGSPVPNDSQGVVAKQPFILKIQAKNAQGVVPDTSFRAQNVSFTLVNQNSSVGEAVSSSTVNFVNGETDPTVTIVQASGTSTAPNRIAPRWLWYPFPP